jgi:putative ABC transport system ATP-binding protein
VTTTSTAAVTAVTGVPAAPYVELRAVQKTYRREHAAVPVLQGIDLSIGRGERVAIMGRSGSGKSTLLNILGCLDTPSEGAYLLDGVDVAGLDDDALSRTRNESLGFVFQSFHLLAGISILDNVKLPLEYADGDVKDGDARARELLSLVGLADRMDHRPNELSGGERQRAAIARALVNRPRMLLADEPTGALDSKSQGAILELFARVHELFGATLVVVTHDPNVATALAGRTIHMLDGRIREDAR